MNVSELRQIADALEALEKKRNRIVDIHPVVGGLLMEEGRSRIVWEVSVGGSIVSRAVAPMHAIRHAKEFDPLESLAAPFAKKKEIQPKEDGWYVIADKRKPLAPPVYAQFEDNHWWIVAIEYGLEREDFEILTEVPNPQSYRRGRE